MSDDPRFVLLSVTHADILNSFIPPNDPCWTEPGFTSDPNAVQEATREWQLVENMGDEDVKWVADNQLAVGGVGAVDLRVIQDMAIPPESPLRDLCGRLHPLRQALSDEEIVRVYEAEAGYAPYGQDPEDLETVLGEVEGSAATRAAQGEPGRRGAHPVHLLTRGQLLEVIAGFTRGGELRALWEGASDAELACLCRFEDAGIRQGDDSVEEINWTARVRLGIHP